MATESNESTDSGLPLSIKLLILVAILVLLYVLFVDILGFLTLV